MIIKSLGRKASANGRSPFRKLYRYMARAGKGEEAKSVIWHGFYGHARMGESEIVAAFEENAQHLKARRNGNVLYHEILSFSAGYRLRGEALTNAIADIGQEYLRYRAPSQLAFGAIHLDTDHAHLHLMVSANGIGKDDREWLSKAQFAQVQKSVEAFTLAHYPELAQTRVYGRDRAKERPKSQSSEQAMKARTGEPSRKEGVAMAVHGMFEHARDRAELDRLLLEAGLRMYLRGKTLGIAEMLNDGSERKHRLSTLGLMPHYEATLRRFGAPSLSQEDKAMPNPAMPGAAIEAVVSTAKDMGDKKAPSAAKVVASELVTGQLHEQWHGLTTDEGTPPPYTDPILERARLAEKQKAEKGTEGNSPPENRQSGDLER
jgi:hypothetical protein